MENKLETLRKAISNLPQVQRAEIQDNEIRVYQNHECVVTISGTSNMEIQEQVAGVQDLVEEISILM